MSPEKKISIQGRKILSGNMASAVGAFLFAALAVLLIFYGTYLIFALGDFALLKLDNVLPFAEELRSSLSLGSYGLIPVTICFALVLISPLFLGLIRFYYLLAKEENPAFFELFRYIGKGYSRALHICVAIILRCFWRILIPLFPGLVCYLTASIVNSELESLAFYHIIWYVISYALIFLGIICASAFCHKYLLYCFIFFEDESLEIEEILVYSLEYIAPFKGVTPKLMLTLTPYILSCILIIPAVFVIPYVLTCLSISAKWLLKLKFKSKED